MKRIFTVLLSLTMVSSLLWAQNINRSFVFIDGDGTELENGATVVRNQIEKNFEGNDVINSGLFVRQTEGAAFSYLRVRYKVTTIDNGTFQLCFPMMCTSQTEPGEYETSPGTLMSNPQDLQSEWFPTADGSCVVEVKIEVMASAGGFPPSYIYVADGPSLTLKFVKSSSGSDDVNGGAYDRLADGVYLDGTTLYITSGVTSLGNLHVNPSEIYCYATIPPTCTANTFTGYGATLHVPAAGMVSYFTALYWCNFNNIFSDAIEPLSVIINASEVEVEIYDQLSLSATVTPGNATPKTVYWSSTNPSVATVSGDGTVTAVSEGECDIIATCVDKVAVCHMTVVSPRVTITLDTHEARLLPNHTLALAATCSPINVDLSVVSSNPTVAIPRLVNGSIMVVGVAEGTATITVNAADGWGNPDTCEVTVYTELGDANSDGYINIADGTSLIDYLLGDETAVTNADKADVNNDGTINIADVTGLVDYLLSGAWPEMP